MKQLQHNTGPFGGQPCSRCGVKYNSKTAYLPCFEEGDTLKIWVNRHAETLLALRGSVPDLLYEMAEEVK